MLLVLSLTTVAQTDSGTRRLDPKTPATEQSKVSARLYVGA